MYYTMYYFINLFDLSYLSQCYLGLLSNQEGFAMTNNKANLKMMAFFFQKLSQAIWHVSCQQMLGNSHISTGFIFCKALFFGGRWVKWRLISVLLCEQEEEIHLLHWFSIVNFESISRNTSAHSATLSFFYKQRFISNDFETS